MRRPVVRARFIAGSLFLHLVLSTLSVILFFSLCQAANPHEEYRKIQREIKKQKQKLEEAKKRETSILSDLETIGRQMKVVESDLRKNRTILRETEVKISTVEQGIASSRREIEQITDWIQRKLRMMHKRGNTPSAALIFMSEEDISRLMRNMKNLQYIAVYERRLLEGSRTALAHLAEQEKELLTLKEELVKRQRQVAAEEKKFLAKKENKESLLTSVKKEKSSFAGMVRELEEASRKIREVIASSERQTEKMTSGTGFGALKGKLPWPAEGRVTLPYGSQRDPKFNTPVFRSGTYIETGSDSTAKAVHGGKVVFAEWFKGYGQLVIVNHGDGYHTLYGSLAEIFTKVGDIIKKKQPVGRIGNSGIINSAGLYFEVRYKGKPLDPLQWLQRR